MQELRSLVAQLRADNEQLHQERVSATPEANVVPSTSQSHPLTGNASPLPSVPVTERLVFVPRDRRCLMFRGKGGVGLDEWLEEVRACMRTQHLSVRDQAFSLFDHLEGEARDEIRYRSTGDREDPEKVISILQELYGCSQSYVALQEANLTGVFISVNAPYGEGKTVCSNRYVQCRCPVEGSICGACSGWCSAS